MAGKTTHQVLIKGFVFDPALLSVSPGDDITWTNEDLAPHTATAMDDSWDTGEIVQGASVTLTVTQAMNLAYRCRYHTHMHGDLAFCPA